MVNSEIRIIQQSINRAELRSIAQEGFGDMVKAVVDVEKGIIAIGGDLHADEEALLLEQGSQQEYLWGINLYPEQQDEHWIEFDSMINVRPSQQNRSRTVEDHVIQEKIRSVVHALVKN